MNKDILKVIPVVSTRMTFNWKHSECFQFCSSTSLYNRFYLYVITHRVSLYANSCLDLQFGFTSLGLLTLSLGLLILFLQLDSGGKVLEGMPQVGYSVCQSSRDIDGE